MDYVVTRVKYSAFPNEYMIEAFWVFEDHGSELKNGIERPVSWVIQQIHYGHVFYTAHLNESGLWYRGNRLIYDPFKWSFNLGGSIPILQTKRKTFVSFYHRDDQAYKDAFQNLTSDLFVNKSVQDGDIDADLSEEYIKQLIQKEYLHDTTVLVVLIGPKTKCRKHVDWEISGALNRKVGDTYAGLLGLLLPTHPDYRKGRCRYDSLPARLADNLETGYAVIQDYTTDRVKLQEYVELAFRNRKQKADARVNSRAQLQKNLCS